MSNLHIWSWCWQKGISFANHLQYVAPKGKHVVMTITNHKRAVEEGSTLLEEINNEVDDNSKNPFVIIGDPTPEDLKSFWFKPRCMYCGDFFQLWPPRKNLQENLQNHLEGLKHTKFVEASNKEKSGSFAYDVGDHLLIRVVRGTNQTFICGSGMELPDKGIWLISVSKVRPLILQFHFKFFVGVIGDYIVSMPVRHIVFKVCCMILVQVLDGVPSLILLAMSNIQEASSTLVVYLGTMNAQGCPLWVNPSQA